MRRFESAEKKATEDGVCDDHGGKTDVGEEERDDAFAAVDQRLSTMSTKIATCFLGSRRRRVPVGCSNNTRQSWLHPGITNSLYIHFWQSHKNLQVNT